MTVNYTSLLGLALPVTGTEAGAWGDVVNNYLTSYLDASVAGTQTITGSQTAVTLAVTNGATLVTVGSGATGSAQFQIITCTGNPASLLTITAPASSRQYIIINSTSTSQSVQIVGAGPTTGVTIVSGEKAHVAWNGSDFVKIATQSGNGSFVDLTVSGNLTLSGGTQNGVLYLNASKVATSGSALTFDGTNLFVGTSTNTNSSRIVSAGTISETVSSTQYLVASQFDIGTAANEIPLNQYLGNLAYQDAGSIAGQVGLSAGTAALPSLVSATDTDTGMWFPAANTLAWSTGGTERVRITSGGNFGIATDNPSSRFEVRFINNSYGYFSNTGDNNTGVRFQNTGRDYAIFVDGGSGSNNPLRFYDFTAAAERARITSTGGFETRPAATGHAVFNEDGVDADFRVESDTQTHMLFVDAGDNSVNINTNTPLGGKLNVNGAIYGNENHKVHYPLPIFNFGAGGISDEYWVLARRYVGSSILASGLMGRIVGTRGSTTSGNLITYQNVIVQSAYLSNDVVGIDSQGSTPSFEAIDIISISGVEYYAARGRASGGPCDNGLWFEGMMVNNTGDTNVFSYTRASTPGVSVITTNVATLNTWVFRDTYLQAQRAGYDRQTINGTETNFNDAGLDYDFRVESDANTHAFFVDAGNSRIGFFDTSGLNSTVEMVTGDGSAGDSGNLLSIKAGAGNLVDKLNIGVSSTSGYGFIQATKPGTDVRPLLIQPLGGGVVFNENGADADFRVESDTDTHCLFVDASTSRVGINNNAPSKTLSVTGVPNITNAGFSFVTSDKQVDSSTGRADFTYSDIIGGMSDNASGIVIISVYRPTTDTTEDAAGYVGLRVCPRGVSGVLQQISSYAGAGISTFTVALNGDGIRVTTDTSPTLRCRLTFLGGGGVSVPSE